MSYGITAACQGRLAADAEMKFTSNGNAWLSFRMAVESKPRQDGGQADPPQWVSVNLWGEKAEALNESGKLVRGAEVYAEGSIQLREWDAQDGTHRSGLSLNAWLVQPLGAASIGRKPQGGPQRISQRTPRGGYGTIRDASGTHLPLAEDQEYRPTAGRR